MENFGQAAGRQSGRIGGESVSHLDKVASETVYYLKNKLFDMRKLRYNKLLSRDHYDSIHKFTSRIKGEINDVR